MAVQSLINQPEKHSVLVSQLVDYINHYSDDGLKIEQHPMTAFSQAISNMKGKLTALLRKMVADCLNSKNENVLNLLCR